MRRGAINKGCWIMAGAACIAAARADQIQFVGQERSIEAWAYAQSFSGSNQSRDGAVAPDFGEFERQVSVFASAGNDSFSRLESRQSSGMDRDDIHGLLSTFGSGDAYNFGFAAGTSDSDFLVRFRLLEPHAIVLAAEMSIIEDFEEADESYQSEIILRQDQDVLWSREMTAAGESGRMAYESILPPGEYVLEAHASLHFETEWENQSASVLADFSLTFLPAPSSLSVLLAVFCRPRRTRS